MTIGAMDWTKLVEPRPGNYLVSSPSWFGNWHSQQQKLVKQGVHIATHRLAAKRVVFEVSKTATSRKRPLIISGALVLASLSISAIWNLSIPGPSNPASNHASLATNCSSLVGGDERFPLQNIDSFQLANWRVVTSVGQQVNGALVQRNFSATCEKRLVSGTVQFAKSGKGWRILTLARLDESGQ